MAYQTQTVNKETLSKESLKQAQSLLLRLSLSISHEDKECLTDAIANELDIAWRSGFSDRELAGRFETILQR
jgi:hypothetical protein